MSQFMIVRGGSAFLDCYRSQSRATALRQLTSAALPASRCNGKPWLKCNRDDPAKQILLYENISLYALAANL